MKKFRLIDTGPLTGPENMAIDAALLDCFVVRESLPLLRLYGWNPPSFSCGRFQEPAEILNLERCQTDSIPVVRRITGGGVIYHGAELTYSLVCPVDFIPGNRSVKDTFFSLTSFLIAFYRGLGLSPVYAADYFGSDKRLGHRTPLCFAGIESCDIMVSGRKIGGNAQRRLKKVIFQHGSIPLEPKTGESEKYLLAASTQIGPGTTSLTEEGVSAERPILAGKLAAAFAETFAVEPHSAGLSAAEKICATTYMQNIE
jgi:lipoate-protein ligase A